MKVTFRLFRVKVHGPTKNAGDRIGIRDLHFKKTLIRPIDPLEDSPTEAAIECLNKLGIKTVGYARMSNCDIILTNDFVIRI